MQSSAVPPKGDSLELAVSPQRLWSSLQAMAELGRTPKGGVSRPALSDTDRDARNLFISWCKEAGCTVTIDPIGNIFARRAGLNNDLKPVCTGSHLDSQPTGGRFDGALGVLAGLEVVRALNDRDVRTLHPIEVVVWTNEEGSRFSPSMVGSGTHAGIFSLEYALNRTDRSGHTLGSELQRIDFSGDAPLGLPIHQFFELHIEQGPVLESEGIVIGVVTHAQGQRWYEINVIGQEAHAGTTPMLMRKDAMVTASEIVRAVNTIALSGGPEAVGTVGSVIVHPNSPNVIPGRVFLTAELRCSDDSTLQVMDAALRESVRATSSVGGVSCSIQEIFRYNSVTFDSALIESIRCASEGLGYACRDIISGAGHDACFISSVAPTGMIFIPCVDGISHNELEDIKPEWAVAGANVLLSVMIAGAVRHD